MPQKEAVDDDFCRQIAKKSFEVEACLPNADIYMALFPV